MGVQSAIAYWGLSTYSWQDFPIFFYKSCKEVEHIDGPIRFIGVPDGVPTKNIVPLGGNLFVTDKWQSACDLVRYGCDVFHTQEALFDYYCYEDAESIAKLEAMSKEYGILEKLHQLRDQGEADYFDQ